MGKIKNIIYDLLLIIVNILPYKIIKKSNSGGIFPFYHSISSDHIPTKFLFRNPDKEKFKKDILFFNKYYKSYSLNKILTIQNEGKSLPSNAFHLTFDDGFYDNYDIALSFLKKNKVNATFFIVKEFLDNKNMFYRNKASLIINCLQKRKETKIDSLIKEFLIEKGMFDENIQKSILKINYSNRLILDDLANICRFDYTEYLKKNKPYMTSNQINELIGAGFTIGAHSIDHPYLQELPLNEQLFQVNDSVNYLVRKFNISYKAFAAPFNDRGLKKEFFNSIFSNDYIDIFFGTQGFYKDNYEKINQRFSMDGKDNLTNNAEIIMKTHLTATIKRKLIGKNYIQRN